MLAYLGSLPGSVAQGLIWGLMAIGVYITFKILDVADLTVDGSICTGGAVAAMLMVNGHSVWLALAAAVLAGVIAGLLTEDRLGLRGTPEQMKKSIQAVENKFTGNTTLAVIVTNAAFDKAELCKIAGMGHDGYARSISPVHTSADGDSIYAVSVGEVSADRDLIGTLAAEVISEAITRAIEGSDSAYGYPCARELGFVN